LQDDDAVNAEAFINKASFLVSNSQHEVLNLKYKVWKCSCLGVTEPKEGCLSLDSSVFPFSCYLFSGLLCKDLRFEEKVFGSSITVLWYISNWEKENRRRVCIFHVIFSSH